jgi:signal transduction histidine kinase/DNA-binding NarL/FixJ family response regulator
MKPSKSIKAKIFFLYIILFGAVIFSGFYIYKEAKKFTIPEEHIVEENNKIFLVSSAINNLYSSEAYGRNAILTGSRNDINIYYKELDTVVKQIDMIQSGVQDKTIVQKLNKVKELLDKKKSSFENLIQARKSIESQNDYTQAFSEVHNIREEIEKNIQPIVIQTRDKEKRSAWARLFKGDNTDTIKTTVNYPDISDSLINAMERIFTNAQKKIDEQQKSLFLQEQRLLLENKNITNELREILENVEQNILTLSYQKINESKARISTASIDIAYIGGSALLVVIILGWIIIKDINQTQEYRLALEKLNDEKEVLLRSKTMLLATVTHDLQTPLGSLIGFTDLLDNTDLKNKQKQYVNNIKSSSQYITNLVNDLTDFSKLENNKISIQEKAFNFEELVKNTCSLLVPTAENKKIKLKWEIAPDLNRHFLSDPYRIKQILTNLITNAIKFTKNGGVYISAFKKSDQIIIKVSDTGIGIAADQIDNIFKEFKQANEGIEKKFGGTGLGLNISKRMIELLNGTIYVESQLGDGSTFTIELPAKESDLSENSFSNKTDFTESFKILKDKSIIVIDDDKLQLQLMEEILVPIFKNVTILNDSTEIEGTLEEKPCDLILSDIQMPKLDGFEMIELLKNNEKYKYIPVIALSGKRDLTIEDYQQAGFVSAHQKPIQITELLLLITSVLFPDFKAKEILLQPKSVEELKTNQTYNTGSLRQFIGDDKDALQNLLAIFIESTQENLLDIQYAKDDFDIVTIGNIAHKMLPMFKQLEINTIVPRLEELEDHQLTFTSQKELEDHINLLLTDIKTIISKITKENTD